MNASTPPPDSKWHKVEVTSVDTYGDSVKRTTEGDGVFVAAGLRALANQLDPPKPSPMPHWQATDVAPWCDAAEAVWSFCRRASDVRATAHVNPVR
jgi:hypothetical protein